MTVGGECHLCGKRRGTLVVGGLWTCARCVYEREMGREPRPWPRGERQHAEALRLFPLPEPIADADHLP